MSVPGTITERPVALITGASRGIGKGIALALGEKGCTVYVTGRSSGDGERTVDTTARQVTEAGGEGRAIQCDHGDDAQVEALFKQIGEEAGHIDILVNNVYKIPTPPAWGGGYWDHPVQIWDDQVGIGLRAHYVASWHAAALMFKSESAAVINVSSPGGQSYHFSACYGAGKLDAARLLAEQEGIDLDQSWFYTDSFSDLPMLEAVAHPIVVNPDPRLRRHSLQAGWGYDTWKA